MLVGGGRGSRAALGTTRSTSATRPRQLRQRTDARVLVGQRRARRAPNAARRYDGITRGFLVRHGDRRRRRRRRRLAALARAARSGSERDAGQRRRRDDRRAPLYAERRARTGVLVAQRRLTEVTTAVEQVRNALLAAPASACSSALALGVALSSTLLRRLGRLRAAALRITAEGPDAPAPRDDGPRRGRRPRAHARPHAGGAAAPGGGAALVRLHRLARAAHAADDAPGHDGAARGGPARRRASTSRTPSSRSPTPAASCAGSPPSPASCSTSAASTPPSSCARSRSSWASWRARSPPSSISVRASSTSSCACCRRPRAAGAAATPTRSRASCGS